MVNFCASPAFWVTILFLSAPLTRAQSVSWNDPGPVPPNQVFALQLVFQDCKPEGNPSLPRVSGLQFLGPPGQETRFSMVNFRTSFSTTLNYSVEIGQAGRLQIPAFDVRTDRGQLRVAALNLEAMAAAPPRQPGGTAPGFLPNPLSPNPPAVTGGASTIQSESVLLPPNPFVGEVCELALRLFVPRAAGIDAAPISRPLWSPTGAEAEPWQELRSVSPDRADIQTRIMFKNAGPAEIPPVKMTFRIFRLVPSIFGLQRQPGGDREISSNPLPVEVQPLPPGAPPGFQGAVGQFILDSKMVPEEVNEGEPITWTLSLKGTGNWPMGVELPARTVPAKMRTIQPKLRREFDGTQVFTGGLVEDLVLIPTVAGEYEMPAVKFIYFDPKKKAYETIEAKPPRITVRKEGTLRPGGPAQVTQAPATAPAPGSGMGPGWGGLGAGKPARILQYGEAVLPREPLEGSGLGFAPIPTGWVRLLAVLPWFVLAAVWWSWARQRAVLTDPERGRKEALQLWKSSIQILRAGSASPEAREKSLLLWQKSVAGTLGVDAAAPAWPEISAAAPTLQDHDRTDLEKCWLESDEALYGRNPSLNGDWCERAAGIADRIDLPRLKAWEPLRPKNLLPWFGLCLVLVLPITLQAVENKGTATPAVAAEDPMRLYREGSFEKAAEVWGERVRKNPSDPISRNNLGLVWFQLGDKERALANGLSAYLVSPQTATVNWNMMIFANASDQLDLAVRRLLEDAWASWLTSRAGVLTWQVCLVAGSGVAALGAGLWLASGYFAWRRKLFFRLGSGILLAGAILAFLAGTALGVYGKLSDRAAVMIVDVVPLRSVPTEVETQAEKVYPPGSIARREKEFLGWSKIRLPNSDVGWVRTENLVPLY